MPATDFRFPDAVARAGRLMPKPLAGLPVLAMLDLARRRHWLDAPDTLHGRRFLLRVEDLGMEVRFRCDRGRFKPLLKEGKVDLTLSAPAMDFARLAMGLEDADTLFFRRRLRIEGDTELGVAVKYWLDATERPAWLRKLATRFAEA